MCKSAFTEVIVVTYQVFNHKGERIATYANASELHTFMKNSVPDYKGKPDDFDSPGLQELKDKDGKVQFQVNTVQS